MRRLTARCKLTITDRRNHLSAESIEAVELLHYWLVSGIIDDIGKTIKEVELLDSMEIE